MDKLHRQTQHHTHTHARAHTKARVRERTHARGSRRQYARVSAYFLWPRAQKSLTDGFIVAAGVASTTRRTTSITAQMPSA